MSPCVCGVTMAEGRRFCQFCRRTLTLLAEGRCVTCTAAIFRHDTERFEGRCEDCRNRRNPAGRPTRVLLHRVANLRYKRRLVA